MRLERVLVDEGLADPRAMARARAIAAQGGRALAAVLVEDAGVPEDALADAVARAAHAIVVDVALGTLDSDAVHLLGEEAAARFLMIPMALCEDGARLRVAFADPLDQAAVAAVQEVTGLDVEPFVATVSSLTAAIEREYRGQQNTRVIRGRRQRAMGTERTRQIAARRARAEPPPTPGGTSPMHRLEQSATTEQRFEALLLALVEAGALTRADYAAALRRLLGRDRD